MSGIAFGVIQARLLFMCLGFRHLATIFVIVLLADCASDPKVDRIPSRIGWDGRVRPSERPASRPRDSYAAELAEECAKIDRELSRYTVYSAEWWDAKKAIDEKEISRLRRITNICLTTVIS